MTAPFDPALPVESWPADAWQLPEELDGVMADRALKERHPELSWNRARALISQGKLRSGSVTLRAEQRLTTGAALEFVPRGQKQQLPVSQQSGQPEIVYQDSQVVVVEKPAGIATVPFEGSEKDSLDRRVAQLLSHKGRPARIHVVHRLDKDTSGILVFARTDAALQSLKAQFRFHTTARRYLAVAHGKVATRTISSRLVQDRGDGLRGSTQNPTLGREATTHVRLLEAFGDVSLIECRLETGRTHQIRIHLAEAGHPLVGERVYGRGFPGQLLGSPRLLLHAAELGFDHPADQRRLTFESEMPPAFGEFLAGRAGAPKLSPRRGPAEPAPRGRPAARGAGSASDRRTRSPAPKKRGPKRG